jgi:hypothetical protein
MTVRANARLLVAFALTAVVGAIVLLIPDIALAATTSARPPKSLWSAWGTVAGLTLFILGFPAVAFAIHLATRRAWVAIGVPVLAVLPLSAIFQAQNPAIAHPAGKLLAVAFTLLAVGLLSAAGMGLAKLLIKEAGRIGAAATAIATAVPLALGAVGPLGGLAIAGMVDRIPPQAALDLIGVSVVVGLAVARLLARLSRSIAGTTIGTSAGLLLVSLWPTAASNAVDAGQGALMMLLLIPLIPVVALSAWAGAKLAGDPPARASLSEA